jgi:ABC-type transporter Mla MlaB component
VARPVESPLATVVIDLEGPITAADIPVLCARLTDLLTETDVHAVNCDASGLSHADVTSIDALARLQLTARRNGCALTLRHASGQLLDLLRLAGLSDVVPIGAPSALEPGRQPEQAEQAGVDEVVEPGDAPF